MDYNYGHELEVERQMLQEGRVKYSRLNFILQKKELDFKQLYEQAEGVSDYNGTIIPLTKITDDLYLPLLNLTGEGIKQAQVLGCYLDEKDFVFMTSTSFRTHQTARTIAHKMDIKLYQGINFFPRPEIQECFPLEYGLMSMFADSNCPFEIKSKINQFSVDGLLQYCEDNKDEVRDFFTTFGSMYLPLLDLLQGRNLIECNLEPTIEEHGEKMAQTLIDFTNHFDTDVLVVAHGNINATLFNYLKLPTTTFSNCGLVIFNNEDSQLQLDEHYRSNLLLEKIISGLTTLS